MRGRIIKFYVNGKYIGKNSTTFLLKLFPENKDKYTVVQIVKSSSKKTTNKISFTSNEVKTL